MLNFLPTTRLLYLKGILNSRIPRISIIFSHSFVMTPYFCNYISHLTMINRLSSLGNLDDNDIKMVEQFVVSLYDRTCPHVRVNECRQYLFTQLGRVIDNCPPTQDALIQHIKRAMLQSRIWASCLNLTEPHVDITEWGWNINAAGEVNPLWTTLPKASQACKEIKNCKCKDGCENTSCTCKSYALPCTELCLCRGYCQ